MPFKSKAQMRKCFALKRQGKAGSWNCEEWANKTSKKIRERINSKKKKLRETLPEGASMRSRGR